MHDNYCQIMAHEIDDGTFLSSFRLIMKMSMIIQT